MAVFSSSLVLDIVVLFIGLLLVIYLYFQRQFNYWKKRGVPYLEPSIPFGNFEKCLFQKESVGQFLQKLYRQGHGNRFLGFYILNRPAILIRDTELMRQILVKDFNYFFDRQVHSNQKSDPLSNNLFLLRGAPWKYLRFKLTPTFTTFRMKQMLPLISTCASQLTEYLKNVAALDKPIEVKQTAAKYATDVISTCAFGIESNCLVNPKAEFIEFSSKIFHFSSFRSFEFMSLFMLPQVVKLMNVKFFQKETTDFLRQVFMDTMIQRERKKIVRDDFMDLLIQLKNKGKVEDEKTGEEFEKIQDMNGISDQKVDFEFEGNNLVAQAAIFFTAGFESNSSSTSFTLYELAMQPQLQDRLRKEICTVLDKVNGEISYEAIKSMTYLHMVLSETLRKYPPLPFLDRIATKDYTIPGTNIVIEKGTPLYIPLLGIQMDEEVFPDPDKYDPERFNEDKKTWNSGYYMPFGEGPRYCIGRRFGMLAAKMGILTVISNFEVSPCAETPKPLILNPKALLLASQGGIPLKFTKINNKNLRQ